MKANLGTSDRLIRIILGVLIAILYFTNVISGTLGIILLVLAGIFILTSVVSFCPAYFILKISTRNNKA